MAFQAEECAYFSIRFCDSGTSFFISTLKLCKKLMRFFQRLVSVVTVTLRPWPFVFYASITISCSTFIIRLVIVVRGMRYIFN